MKKDTAETNDFSRLKGVGFIEDILKG